MKISIITVVFNRREDLKKTIGSIRAQTFRNIEYIVIDGGSTDGTLNVITENQDIISKYVSEKDNGIYDAMNKGLRIAEGDYVWFLNAGDEIYNADTLENIFRANDTADAYYGDVMYVDREGNELEKRKLKKPPEKFSYKSMIYGMVVIHQSFIVKRALAAVYDTNYKYCSDIEWMISSLKKCGEVYNTHLILSKFQIGGYSKNNIIPSNRERFGILVKHFGLVRVLLAHVVLSFRFIKYFFTSKEKYY